jgi:hypothetical protein
MDTEAMQLRSFIAEGKAEELHTGDNSTVCVAAGAHGAKSRSLKTRCGSACWAAAGRIVRNLLPMPERVLTGFEYGAARRAGGGRWNAAALMRIAALLRRSFNRGPAVFRGKGVRLRSLRAIGTA